MSDSNSNPFDNKPTLQPPSTPKESSRSKYDQFATPTQSPMIKISELEEPDAGDSPSKYSDILPPSSSYGNSKRNSWHFSPANNQSAPMNLTNSNGSLYNFDNNSSSSLLIPGGNVAGNRSSISSLKYMPPPSAPIRSKSPTRNRSPIRSSSPIRSRSPSPKKYQPFNFRSTNLSTPSVNNPRASHRKGHRYKHSSVSMNFFQEPKARAPLKIPASFPIPTIHEFLTSCNSVQKRKLSWSGFHLCISILVFLIGFKYSLASFSTLSHLVFYDSLGALTVVFVDIMSNFDVWSRSSMKFPFGLGRIEVLFGFALSVSLIFVGCDLISHFLEEFMVSFLADDGSGHDHSSGHNHHNTSSTSEINLAVYELVVFLTIGTTFISSNYIASKDRVNDMITNFSFLQNSIVKNPTHFITLVFSSYLSIYPFVSSFESDLRINEVSTLFISVLICYIGWKIVKYLGSIILLTYPNSKNNFTKVSNKLSKEIKDLDLFKSNYSIENLIIFRVHMKLLSVFINIKMIGGADDDELNLRYKVNDIIKRTLGNDNIETTIDINRI